MPERFSISDENILSEIEDIRKRINDKIDQMIGSMNEHDDFYRLKVASFIASFSGFVLLIISSEISDSKIDLVSKTFAYLLLCYVPIAAFFIARDFKRSFNKYGKERVAIDSEYVSLVNRIFQTI